MSDTASEVDVLDPDWRSFEKVMMRRMNFFVSMRRLDELSKTLIQQADEEYERQAKSPKDGPGEV